MSFVMMSKRGKPEAKASGQAKRPFTSSWTGPVHHSLEGEANILAAKLRVGSANDPLEAEADAMADAVISGRNVAASGIADSPTIHQDEEILRSRMESSVGRDLGDVRMHTGSAAARAARSIGAKAFTVGHNVYFGAGGFKPETTEGQRLIAHELAHVVQNQRERSNGAVVRRSPAEPASEDTGETYASLKIAFGSRYADSISLPENLAKLQELAPRLAEMMPTEAALTDGPIFMLYMFQIGAPEAANTIFQKIVDLRFEQWGVDPLPNKEGVEIAGLFNTANVAANEGEYDRANDILEYIFISAQVLALTVSKERITALNQANSKIASGESVDPELNLEVKPADLIRQVFEFYPHRERLELSKGDMEGVETTRAASRKLSARLENEVFSADLTSGPLLTVHMEKTTNERDQPGYEVSGGGNSQILTQMPNAPLIQGGPHYTGTREPHSKTVAALRGQAEFLAQVYRFPGVRKEFPEDPPNMLSIDDRVRLWSAMTNDLASGNQNLLLLLSDYIQLYLQSYTRHSYYNISDFGDNYLETDLPQDYAGRLVQDCGVYALTTAYELLQISKRTGKLDIQTELVTTLDHVMLTVIDRANDSAYILNNDDFIGPIENTRQAINNKLAQAYARTFDEDHSFIRMMMVDVMDSDSAKNTSSGGMKDELWKTYKTATSWGFSQPRGVAEIDPDPNAAYHLYRGIYNTEYQTLRHGVLELNQRAAGNTTSFIDLTTPELLERCIQSGIAVLNIYLRVMCKPFRAYTPAIDREMKKLNPKDSFVGTNDPTKGDMLSLLKKLIVLFADRSDSAKNFLQVFDDAIAGRRTVCGTYYPHEYAESDG